MSDEQELQRVTVVHEEGHRVVIDRHSADLGWDDPRVVRHLALQRAIDCKPYVYDTETADTDRNVTRRLLARADDFYAYVTEGTHPPAVSEGTPNKDAPDD